jgi:hypothetical protein
MIFQDFVRGTYGKEWHQAELFKYFKAQIDNSIELGWEPSDIIILTNLPFEYREVKIIKSIHECTYNKYFNKLLGIWELIYYKHIGEPFWFHDFDDWQTYSMTLPEFDGEIGACKYINFTQWNTGSLFIKPTSLPFWQLCKDFIESNDSHPTLLQIGDENIFNLLYNQNIEQLRDFITEVPYDYNIGMTGLDERLARANSPKVVAFKPSTETITKLEKYKLVPERLLRIFSTYEFN